MKWSGDNLKTLTKLYAVGTVFGNLDFSRSLFMVFLVAQGLSHQELGVLQAVLFWATFFFEVPTGILADRFGRKLSVLLGYGTLAMMFVLITTVTSFSSGLLVFFLWGIAFAFLSGANSAFLYDGLKEANALDRHITIMSRVRSLCTVSMAVAITIGGIIYSYKPQGIFWVSAACAVIGLFVFTLLPETREHREVTFRHLIQSIHQFTISAKGRNLMIFIVAMSLIEMMSTPFYIFSQLSFSSVGWSSERVALLMGAGFLVSALGQWVAPKFQRETPLFHVVTVAFILIGLLVINWVFEHNLVRAVVFLLVNGISAFLFVHSDQYIQDHCESSIRASLLSVQSFVNAVMIGLSYVLIGFFSKIVPIATALSGLAFPILLSVVMVAWHSCRCRR